MPQETPELEPKPAEPTMVARALLCHQTVGRFRVRVPERRGDEAYFERVRGILGQHASTLEVATNPITGSILVLHRLDSVDLLEYAETEGLFRSTKASPPPHGIPGWFDKLGTFDAEALWARTEKAPERAATGMFMLAAMQALRGSLIPSASTLVLEAIRLLRQRPSKPEGSGGGGSSKGGG